MVFPYYLHLFSDINIFFTVNIDDPSPVLKKAAPVPAPAPLRVGDADKPASAKGEKPLFLSSEPVDN